MRGPGPVVVYTSLRIALFAVSAAVLAAAGLRGLLLLAVALVVSGLLSYVLLSRHRDAMSAAVVQGSERVRERMRERTEAEDYDEDGDGRDGAPAADPAADPGRDASDPPERTPGTP